MIQGRQGGGQGDALESKVGLGVGGMARAGAGAAGAAFCAPLDLCGAVSRVPPWVSSRGAGPRRRPWSMPGAWVYGRGVTVEAKGRVVRCIS